MAYPAPHLPRSIAAKSIALGNRSVLAVAALVVAVASAVGCAAAAPAETTSGSIAETLGVNELSLVALQDLRRAALVVYEEQLALCMKGQGFDYVGEFPAASPLQDRAGTNTEAEFVERFGWGIVYSVTEQKRSASTAAAVMENTRIYRGLSAAEREAYDIAMDGSFDSEGCKDVATDSATSAVPGAAVIDEYSEQIDQTVERFATDLRIVAFHRKWSRCMSEYAFDYSSPQELSEEITARVSEEGLADARVFELDAASASLECGVGPTVYGQPAVYATVLDGLEQRFISENPEFLETSLGV